MEFEDDLYFADLSKQISLLIMDDDEVLPVSTYPSVSFQDLSRENSYQIQVPSPYIVEQSCRRESRGTGVFIPRSSQPRRKHRQGRHTSFNSKSHKEIDHTRSTASLYPKQA